MPAIDASEIDVKVRLDLYEIPRRMMDAVIRRDADQYADCYTEDGVWDARPLFRVSSGRETIRAGFLEAWEVLDWGLQGQFQTIIASYDGERAQLRTYLAEIGVMKGATAPSPIGIGLYTDDLVLVGGKWRITLHALTPIYFGSNDFASPMFKESVVIK